MNRILSTVDVPARHLKATFLVEKIPFKTIQSHPHVSYTLYIPEEHLNPDPYLMQAGEHKDLPVVYSLPLLPLVVTIHGTGRGAEYCRDALIPFARKAKVAILAPLFPAGSGLFDSLEEYKLLRTKTYQSDIALLNILDEVKVRWPGIATDKVFMTGFSGGGQFSQRFMLIYPEKLHAVSIGAPGKITLLDKHLDWPKGIRNVAGIFGRSVIEPSQLQHVHIQLIGGSGDTETHGGEEFWKWLAEKKGQLTRYSSPQATGEVSDKGIVTNRVLTLRQLQRNLEDHGIEAELELVDDAQHESLKMVPRVTEFLLRHVQQLYAEGSSSC